MTVAFSLSHPPAEPFLMAGNLTHLIGTAEDHPLPLQQGGLATWQLKKAITYLMQDLSESVSLAELADLVNLSVSHFCRAFAKSTGLPPHRWRLVKRIERAKELLLFSDHPIVDIAAEVGYKEQAHFTAAFRQATGYTPNRYRRQFQS